MCVGVWVLLLKCSFVYTVSAMCRLRLKEELMAWLEDDFLNYSNVLKMKDFKFHKLPVQPNCVEWMGGRCYTPTHCSACTVCGPCVCTCACECTVL